MFQHSEEFLKCIKLNGIRAEDSSTSVLIKGNDVDILFCQDDYSQGSPVDPPPHSTESLLSTITRPASWQVKQLSFDADVYFAFLKTTNMGRCVLYAPVMTSTHALLCGNLPFSLSLSSKAGVICVAGQQTKGKGTMCVCVHNFVIVLQVLYFLDYLTPSNRPLRKPLCYRIKLHPQIGHAPATPFAKTIPH